MNTQIESTDVLFDYQEKMDLYIFLFLLSLFRGADLTVL